MSANKTTIQPAEPKTHQLTERINLPDLLIEERKQICNGCSCTVDFHDSCSECPNGRWKKVLCNPNSLVFIPTIETKKGEPPSVAEMVKSASKSAANWISAGFKHTDEETLQKRLESCSSCEFWDSKALYGTGRCMKCGCSTWAKLRMATEKCPIGKW